MDEIIEIEYNELTLRLDKEENVYVVVDCDKDVTSVKLPIKVDGIYIGRIGEKAFENCQQLKSFEFPDYEDEDYLEGTLISEIEGNAFYGCSSLEEIEIPYSVTVIGWGAFARCSALKKATFRDGYIYIAPYAFSDCESLAEVTRVSDVNEGVFDGCDSLKYLPITDDIDEICESAFAHCQGLEHIVIPKSVERIEMLAFRSCYNLKTVKFEADGGWYVYFGQGYPTYDLDLSDPAENARRLSRMDFDDGVRYWARKKCRG